MSREQLIQAIYNDLDEWSCPDGDNCDNVEPYDCRECAEHQLAEYEETIRADELKKFAEWCKLKGYSHYEWRMLIEQYEQEQIKLKSIDNDFTDDLLNMGYAKGYQKGREEAIMDNASDITDFAWELEGNALSHTENTDGEWETITFKYEEWAKIATLIAEMRGDNA